MYYNIWKKNKNVWENKSQVPILKDKLEIIFRILNILYYITLIVRNINEYELIFEQALIQRINLFRYICVSIVSILYANSMIWIFTYYWENKISDLYCIENEVRNYMYILSI